MENNVKSRNHTWSQPRSRKRPRPSAEELAAVRRLGFNRRAEWRAELAAAVAPVPAVEDEAARRRAQFAAAVARAELGRFYWDGRRHAAPKRAKPGAKANGRSAG
jgi:hypothetical protein